MGKRIITILLVACLSLIFASCGKTSAPASEPESEGAEVAEVNIDGEYEGSPILGVWYSYVDGMWDHLTFKDDSAIATITLYADGSLNRVSFKYKDINEPLLHKEKDSTFELLTLHELDAIKAPLLSNGYLYWEIEEVDGRERLRLCEDLEDYDYYTNFYYWRDCPYLED